MRKMLVHFRARAGMQDELVVDLSERIRTWRGVLGQNPSWATLLRAHSPDPLRLTGDGMAAHAFDASIELEIDAQDVDDQLVSVVRDLADALEACIHGDLSALQIGTDKTFMACDPAPIRLQYCMRRRHDFSHAAYLKRYEEDHARFGLATRGIVGYRQFHIDQTASHRACAAAGFGVSRVDSVSELHISSLDSFFAAMPENAKIGAREDEEAFVDGASSIMWSSDAILRLADDPGGRSSAGIPI